MEQKPYESVVTQKHIISVLDCCNKNFFRWVHAGIPVKNFALQ